jgi:hypothetical protein
VIDPQFLLALPCSRPVTYVAEFIRREAQSVQRWFKSPDFHPSESLGCFSRFSCRLGVVKWLQAIDRSRGDRARTLNGYDRASYSSDAATLARLRSLEFLKKHLAE